MNSKTLSRFLLAGFLIWIPACSGNPLDQFFEKPYFEEPQAQMTRADRELFDRALFRQENNRMQAAVKVWEQFLQKHPRSFEAHNNLGLVFFEDDQVDPAIVEFETALALEPNDEKIKKNLVRVLKFKSTLLNEARDYNGAVDTLKRAQEISSPREKEQIGFIIEKFEGNVFEQAKQTNTVEAYEGFLKRFPTSTKNADEARMKIEGLKPRSPEVLETAMDALPQEESSAMASMDEKENQKSETPTEPSRVEDSTWESADQGPMVENDSTETADKDRTVEDGSTLKGDEAGQANVIDAGAEESPLVENPEKAIVPEQPKEVARAPARPIEIATHPEPKPSTGADLFPAPDPEVASLKENPPSGSLPLERRVEIVTRKDPLRVREEPSLYSRVVATVEKGSQVTLVTEQSGWYKVEFSAGQMGWISKKYSRLME